MKLILALILLGSEVLIQPSFSQEERERYENIKRVSYAAIIDRCVAHPLDNLITAHQNENGKITTVARKMLKGGIDHLYSGFTFSLISAIPVRIGTYSTFFIAHDYFKKNDTPSLKSSVNASLISAVTESCALFPSDLSRTRKLLYSQGKLSLPIILKSYSMLLSRLMIENTIGLAGADILISNVKGAKESPELTFFLALVAGIGSQILPAPFDWIKTKYMDGKQVNPKQEVINMMKQGFIRNIALRSIRAGICNAVVFSVVGNAFSSD